MHKVAVVGMGYWGRNLVRVFHQLGALGVVCDDNESRKSEVDSKYPGVAFESDFGQVLENKAIEAVVLATPAVLHYSMAKAALLAGKDVFVEKPLALTPSEGEQLVRLAAECKRILMVGHILRYHPAVIRLQELIRAGELGQIQYIYSNRLNIGKIRTEENILWSFAPHDLSVIMGLLGEEPISIACQGGSYLSPGVYDTTTSEFAFRSGVRAHIFVSWLHPFKEQRLVVIGSKKMACFDDSAKDKLVTYEHKVEWKNRVPEAVKAEAQPVELKWHEPLKAECEHFLRCLETRDNPITDGNEALGVLRALQACEHSLRATSPAKAETSEILREPEYFVHSTAVVDQPVEIGKGTKIWHYSHVHKNAKIGERCVFGQNCNVADNVIVGNNVKVQNNVSLYTGAVIEDDVFLGPSCVLTNVTNPRSQVNRHSLYEKTLIRRGATIGANATIVCGTELGRYCFIGAGAVVAKSVPDYALMIGNPARQAGWMSRHGHRLHQCDSDGNLVCPESGFRYREVQAGVLCCLDLDEASPLPKLLSAGSRTYDEFKAQPAFQESFL